MAQRVEITRATAVGNFHGDSLALSIIILMKSVGGTEVMSVQVPRLQVALEGFRFLIFCVVVMTHLAPAKITTASTPQRVGITRATAVRQLRRHQLAPSTEQR